MTIVEKHEECEHCKTEFSTASEYVVGRRLEAINGLPAHTPERCRDALKAAVAVARGRGIEDAIGAVKDFQARAQRAMDLSDDEDDEESRDFHEHAVNCARSIAADLRDLLKTTESK